MKELLERLEQIGLTKQEARAYFSLHELQEAKSGTLSQHSHIATSNLYTTLNALIKKGLVSYRLQNNIKIFMPSSPDSLKELVRERERKLREEERIALELIRKLKRKEITTEPYSNYKYYENLSGVKSMWHEINNKMKEGCLIRVYTGQKQSYQRLIGFYTEHHQLRAQKSVPAHLIFPLEDRELAQKRQNNLTEVRFSELKNEAEWGVFGEYFYIQYLTGKTPRGFLIQDRIFATTFAQVFDQVWTQTKR